MEKEVVKLLELARLTGLPAAWLKREAIAGRLPSLRVGRVLLFNLSAVRRSLAERAALVGTQACSAGHPNRQQSREGTSDA